MFAQIIDDHHRQDDKIKRICKATHHIGSVSITKDERESNYRNTFLEMIHCKIADVHDYFLTQIERPGVGVIINDKIYAEWNEVDLYEFAEKVKFGDVIQGITREDEKVDTFLLTNLL